MIRPNNFNRKKFDKSKDLFNFFFGFIILLLLLVFFSEKYVHPNYNQLLVTKGTLKSYSCDGFLKGSQSLSINLYELERSFTIPLQENCHKWSFVMSRDEKVILKHWKNRFYEVQISERKLIEYNAEGFNSSENKKGLMWLLLLMIVLYLFIDLHKKDSYMKILFVKLTSYKK